jgi:hypothetical protein
LVAKVTPLLGQIQLAVDEHLRLGGDQARIGEEDADLAIVELSGGPAVLALHPCRLRPLLEEARLIDHQDRGRIGQVLAHIRHQIVAHGVHVPARGVQEALHPVGGRLACFLGQLPAILALGVAEQALEIGQRALARLSALEVGHNAGM